MAPSRILYKSLLISLSVLPLSYASWGVGSQRLDLGPFFQLEPRSLSPRADDIGSDCGGDPGCSTTNWGCQCGFADDSWIDEPAPTKAPEPEPEPEPPATMPPSSPPATGTLGCNDNKPGYKKFSQKKAADAIDALCKAYSKDGVVLSEEGDSLTDSKKYFKLEQIDGAADDDATLVINPNWAKSGCADMANPTELNFEKLGVDKCKEYFMRAVDGCGDLDNPAGDDNWKWGGQNRDACVFWNVAAQ
ncbi:MAG: hypothetical protein Q9186_007503 [Xanthomendoza sp. 1 TL-2023]